MWFYASKTRRAIKIPSIQRVFGEASYGDLTQLSLSQDYILDGSVCEEVMDDKSVLRIPLVAKSDEETYAKLSLIVDAENRVPVGVDYFVASGKHIKSARFPDAKNTDNICLLYTSDAADE